MQTARLNFRVAFIAQLVALAALLSVSAMPSAHAQVCPFDDGNSSLAVDGLILTRYALGITGAPLVAGTDINAVDAVTVEGHINCPSCGLNITGNPTMTVTDATIISRKLAGFSGAALTDGLNLGSGTRNTPASVNSFLLAGCGATGGTVSSITAGTGLTGGVITASGIIAADTAYLQRRVSSSCSTGSFITAIAADGSITCSNPSTGASGTVTNIATGTGLTGGPISTTGTITADTTYLQRRVTSSCSAGSFITAIAADGTATCGTPPAGTNGTVTSIATGPGLAGGPISTTGTINLAATQLLPTVACANNQVPKWNGSAWLCANDATTGTAWVQGGNAFGAPGVIGTTDAQPLTVKSGGAAVSLLTAGNNGLRITENTSTTVGAAIGVGVHPQTTFTNTVNGSPANTVAANIVGATIGGGGFLDFTGPPAHTNYVGGHFGTVGGGLENSASGPAAVVSGGQLNQADGGYATVAGGTSNGATGSYSTVGGGYSNSAAGDSATVGGGLFNAATGQYAAVGGGEGNQAASGNAVVGGGIGNYATGASSVVSGGATNAASAQYSTVIGGRSNTANGLYSAVGGGQNNTADGDYSVAMGRRAKTLGNGSFQFADSNNFDFSSSTVNAFRVRATGGVRFVTEIDGTGATTWSCAAFAGAGWSCSSDRNLKQGLKKLDGKKILAKLAAMPVYQWQPKGQNAHVKHFGPMAQDFMKAFGVGDDDKMIGMQDADGVALAAIQGLNQIVKAKDAKIAALEKANAVMQREMAAIKKRLGM